MPSLVAFVPARAGSERVPGKNVRPLAGHPLLAYAIATAQQSGVADRVICSTDSEEIAAVARWYGAEVPFLRPAEYATSTSPDVEWITDAIRRLPERYDLFAIVRPTSPFRGPDALRRGLEQLLATPGADSLRAVEPVKQHPGKMWVVEAETMRPLLDQEDLDVPWHSSQYQALPRVFVQNAALEIVWTRALDAPGHAGRVIAPFLTEGAEGLNIDDEDDWARAEALVGSGGATLPLIERAPYAPAVG
jgi:CMP-N,N'-diacetyllegionaminic acid synthase